MKKPFLILCLLLTLMLCSCGTNGALDTGPEPSDRLLGAVEGNTYKNYVIGFSATIPEGWSVASEQQMSSLSGISQDYLKQAAGLEPDSQMFIFFCSKYGYGYVGTNPCIGITVSNQDALKPLLTGGQALNDYIEQNRPSIEKQYGGKASISGEPGVQMGGSEYSVIHITADLDDTHIIQDIYITGISDYVLIITETYSEETDKPEADTFLTSLKAE